MSDLATRTLVTALDTLGQDATISANEALAQQVQCCRGVAASLVSRDDKVA